MARVSQWLLELPQRWQDKLPSEITLNTVVSKKGKDVPIFEDIVDILFEDRSSMHFENATMLEDEEFEELCILTEHSGYYIVSTRGLEAATETKSKSRKFSKVVNAQLLKYGPLT